MMEGNLYIIESIKNKSYYIGSAKDVERRVGQHNSGNVKATKYKRPYKLVFSQSFNTIEKAREAERKIKKWKRSDFIEKIIRDGKMKSVGP